MKRDDTWFEDGATADERSKRDDGVRYEGLGPLGEGGMGTVERVRDTRLNRVVALKRIQPEARAALAARFVAEAQATAQLEHPSIVPVYDMGEDEQGPWFTMREVRGQSLTASIRGLHDGTGPSLGRLIAALVQVCEAVGYAHERGVLHRDLKPDNVLLGEHGEVYVVDWGLAKIADEDEETAVSTDRNSSLAEATRVGTVTGTPAYMSPEQARGRVDRVDARSDVYGLGAILFELLSGGPPVSGCEPIAVVARVACGDLDDLHPGPNAPEELVRVCLRALSLDPDDRFASASQMAGALTRWLDGTERRERARRVLDGALGRETEVDDLRERAVDLETRGLAGLGNLEDWQPESVKAPFWEMLDRAAEARTRADLIELEIRQGLHAALRIDDSLSAGHAALAQRYLDDHRQAERRRDDAERYRAEVHIANHLQALPGGHEIRKVAERYLDGAGRVTLLTDPPGAAVKIAPFVEVNRRLVPGEYRVLGTTPIVEAPLAMGSYVCVIEHPDCEPVVYPVAVRRLEHWSGIPPGGTEPLPIPLPPRGHLGRDEVYVPPGWFRAGSDLEGYTQGVQLRDLWCDGFVAATDPVTMETWIGFLNTLLAEGRSALAERCVPRERDGTRASGLHRTDSGYFLGQDSDGDLWNPGWPVMMVDWFAARTYLDWLSDKTGRPWRLPHGFEWEKAARGVDGRLYPWGDRFDASWCHTVGSHRGERSLADVRTYAEVYPADTSVYGVRGLAGNTRDWCATLADAPVPVPGARVELQDLADIDPSTTVTMRGGSWRGGPQYARSINRNRERATYVISDLGVRGVYSWPERRDQGGARFSQT